MAARAALASSLSRLSTRSPAANLIPRRGLAAGGDHHGPPRINIWEDPMSPSKWKEEHFVLASLSGWGLLIYGGLKAFGGKKEKEGRGDCSSCTLVAIKECLEIKFPQRHGSTSKDMPQHFTVHQL